MERSPQVRLEFWAQGVEDYYISNPLPKENAVTIIDTAEGISAWQFLSAISQLGLEVKTGTNYYGRTSVLKGIQRRGWTSVTGNATLRNKVLALAELLWEQPSSPVVDLARATLAEALDANGWVITLT